MWNCGTRDPPPLHGENHLKFPFWLFAYFLYIISLFFVTCWRSNIDVFISWSWFDCEMVELILNFNQSGESLCVQQNHNLSSIPQDWGRKIHRESITPYKKCHVVLWGKYINKHLWAGNDWVTHVPLFPAGCIDLLLHSRILPCCVS